MDAFRRLMLPAMAAGAAAGIMLFLVQWVTVGPLIEKAETFEQTMAPDAHAEHGARTEWEPADGFERIAYTAAGTILTGIGFSALLFGIASLLRLPLDAYRGLLLGVAGFVCFALAPGVGLPPKPPGVPGADLQAAQIWWGMTAALTAAGLVLIFAGTTSLTKRIAGLAVIALPHLVGAPRAEASTIIPGELARQFALTSVATQGLFWLVLGAFGGYLLRRER